MGCPGPKPKSSTVSEVHHAAERSFCCRRFGIRLENRGRDAGDAIRHRKTFGVCEFK